MVRIIVGVGFKCGFDFFDGCEVLCFDSVQDCVGVDVEISVKCWVGIGLICVGVVCEDCGF